MKLERAKEIERTVIYRYLDDIRRDLEECDNSHVAFNIGRHIGMMQIQLNSELDKEIDSLND